MNYNYRDLIEAYRRADITKYDNLFVTTGLGLLGKPENCNSTKDLCEMHLRALMEAAPKANLIIPSYSYSFYGNNLEGLTPIFDRTQTNSKIGPFSNYIIENVLHERSIDPMVSVIVVGKDIGQLLQDIEYSSYGKDSIFGRLLKKSTGCLSIGLGTNWTPFIHYLDERNNVEYRYNKIFRGKIKDYQNESEIYWNYSVPIESEKTNGDCQRLGFYAELEGIWKKLNIGKSMMCICDYKEYYEFATNFSRKNVWCTAKGPKQTNIGKCRTTEEEIKNLENMLNKIRGKRTGRSIELNSIVTGSAVSNYIVPEEIAPIKLYVEDRVGNVLINEEVKTKISNLININSYSFEITINSRRELEEKRIDGYNIINKGIGEKEELFNKNMIEWYDNRIKRKGEDSYLKIKYHAKKKKKKYGYIIDAPIKLEDANGIILVDITKQTKSKVEEIIEWTRTLDENKIILYGARNLIFAIAEEYYLKLDLEMYIPDNKNLKKLKKEVIRTKTKYTNMSIKNSSIENQIFTKY